MSYFKGIPLEVGSDAAPGLDPVMMPTSCAVESDLFQSYQLGANGNVAKPMISAALMLVVASLAAFWAATHRPPPAPLPS